ncbi:MAG: hypothetical protein IPI48_05905 [bacterium]|nr:hypothetical protein [bacterium]
MRSWRQFPALSLIACCLAVGGLSGSVALAAAGAVPDNGEARWALTAGDAARVSVTLQVPAPTVRDSELLGETFAEISLPGAEAAGVPGQPALPVLGRFVAVPAGMTVRLVAARAPEQVLDGAWRPLPAQPVSAADAPATWDRAWYAQKATATRAPVAEVGEPAVMHGVRVVPVTVRPVSWNRATGQVAWAPSVELDLEFVPATDAAAPVRADRPLPASFATLLEQNVLGFDKASATTVPLGTWVCITPNDASVLTAVEPLVTWRARQGYNVVSVTTAETGTSTTAIKAWLQNQYNTLSIPLEMVCLVGDASGTVGVATWHESLSGYNGEGDHPYTQLDGTDILPDVHLGRLSAGTATELTNIVNKIVDYESNPWLTNDTNWFRRAGLTGDPSTSGYSCIWTNQWVKDQLLRLNYATVDTIWSGNFATLMTANVSTGESIFTYRGYYGMSGLTTGHISTMSNGRKLPYAIIMTCGTGSFASEGSCRSEAFLRTANGGGVAAIGTATTGTHTRYNNCIFAGVVDGVLNTGDQRTGPSLSHGKLVMYLNYFATEPEEVTIWATWNNLMGDPATSIWTAVPANLAVTAPAALDDNANALPALVTAGGSPVKGALVALYRKGVISVSALTGADGRVVLPVSGLVDGTFQLTVTGTNLKPWLGVVTVGPQAVSLAPGALTVDDDAVGASLGDGDGLAEPGETVELMIGLANGGTGTATAVTAQLSSPDALAVVAQAAAGYGSILSGATAVQDTPFVVQIDAGMRGGNGVPLQIVGTAAGIDYAGLVDFKVNGPALTLTASLLGGVGGTLNPGQTGTLRITVRNDGNIPMAGTTVTLSSTDPWVTASDADGTLPAIAVGGLGDNSGNLFSLQVSPDCLPGHLSVLNVDITFAEGGKAQVAVPVTFGTRTVTDPVGPDAGGYYAFDNGDLGYGQAPVYEWVEIDPALGGPGQSVGLTDFAIYSDDTRVVDLPFPFTYYGRDFSKISVCSNGWLAMGATYQRHYRNRTLPAVESPEDMVCVYWDELYAVSGDGGVFTWYDAVNHRFIIEWRRMRNEEGAGARDVPGRSLRPCLPGRRRPDPDAVPDRQPGRLAGRLLDGRHPVHFTGHGPAVLLLERLRRRRCAAGCRARHHVPHLCAAGDGRGCRQRDQRQRRRRPDHGRHGVCPRQRAHGRHQRRAVRTQRAGRHLECGGQSSQLPAGYRVRRHRQRRRDHDCRFRAVRYRGSLVRGHDRSCTERQYRPALPCGDHRYRSVGHCRPELLLHVVIVGRTFRAAPDADGNRRPVPGGDSRAGHRHACAVLDGRYRHHRPWCLRALRRSLCAAQFRRRLGDRTDCGHGIGWRLDRRCCRGQRLDRHLGACRPEWHRRRFLGSGRTGRRPYRCGHHVLDHRSGSSRELTRCRRCGWRGHDPDQPGLFGGRLLGPGNPLLALVHERHRLRSRAGFLGCPGFIRRRQLVRSREHHGEPARVDGEGVPAGEPGAGARQPVADPFRRQRRWHGVDGRGRNRRLHAARLWPGSGRIGGANRFDGLPCRRREPARRCSRDGGLVSRR